jgi:hypothetical protein
VVGELVGQPVEVAHLAAHRLLHLVAHLAGRGRRAVAGELAQAPAQGGEAVVAEGHREPGHRGLAHPCQVGDLGSGEERRRRGVLHQAVRDAALRGGEANALEEPDHPVGIIHKSTLCISSFTRNGLGLGLA